MITFKLLGQKYVFPTCWSDVTYDQQFYHIYPRTLAESIHCFTGIPLETLQNATINGLEKISYALAFMNLSPHMDKRTAMIGRYPVPGEPKFESVGQFEDLRGLIKKMPRKERKDYEYEDFEKEMDVYLTACAIYLQKVIDGRYNDKRIEQTKTYLRGQSCIEVITNGAFFLSKALSLSPPSMSLFQKLRRAMKNWLQALPGYQKTLDSLQRSSGSPGK